MGTRRIIRITAFFVVSLMVTLDIQRPGDLLEIREPFLSSKEDHRKIIVHGHEIVDEPKKKATVTM